MPIKIRVESCGNRRAFTSFLRAPQNARSLRGAHAAHFFATIVFSSIFDIRAVLSGPYRLSVHHANHESRRDSTSVLSYKRFPDYRFLIQIFFGEWCVGLEKFRRAFHKIAKLLGLEVIANLVESLNYTVLGSQLTIWAMLIH